MDLPNSATKGNTSDRPETEAGDEYQTPPPPAPQSQLIYYTNGSLSYHHQPQLGNGILRYRECLRNHAATIGGHALDGCREFIAALTASSADPSSVKCAACGCHRNFHRREEYRPVSVTSTHFSRRPRRFSSSRSTSPSLSPSPPRKAVEFLSSAVRPLGLRMDDDGNNRNEALHVDDLATAASKRISGHGDEENNKSSKKNKRSRTKFTQDQKEKMQVFAESLGWKMQKSDGRLVEEFCNEVVGVSKHVFKVWMHNNKNTFAKKDNDDDANENGGRPPADDHRPPRDSPEKSADD